MSNSIKLFLGGFELLFSFLEEIAFPAFRAWWWTLPPLFLSPRLVSSWLWWRRVSRYKKRKYVLLEIKLPVEILKPIRAMEHVLDSLASPVLWDVAPGPWREKWIEGDSVLFPVLSLEIANFNKETHFYVRTDANYRDTVETAFYSQYPEIEISEVDDYVDTVPRDIPNKEWNIDCRELVLFKPDPYPIKTYRDFETESERKEEKIVDPMSRLLEALSALEKGEQVWIQILITVPFGDKTDWVDQGKAIRNGLVKRPGKPSSPRPLILDAIDFILRGASEEKEEPKKDMPYPEMMLTPGEKEIVKAIENKIAKNGFSTTIRVMYLAKREAWFKPHLGLPLSFLFSFGTGNLNRFGVFSKSTTKVKSPFFWFLDERRKFVKKRRAMENYKTRMQSMSSPNTEGTSVLSVEELATLFHFTGRTVAPAPFVPRLESRKGEAPSNLPTE